MAAPRDPSSIRSRVRVALIAIGLFAANADIIAAVKKNGKRLVADDLKTVPVQISQVRNEMLKAVGIKPVKGLGRLTQTERDTLASKWQAVGAVARRKAA